MTLKKKHVFHIMRKAFAIFLALVALFRYVQYWCSPVSEQAHQEVLNDFVEVDGLRCQRTIDFGRLSIAKGRGIGKRTLLLYNTTDEAIEILSPEPDCPACTTVAMNGFIVPARGSLPIELKIELLPSSVRKRQIVLTIRQKNKKKKPLEIVLLAQSAFSVFASQENYKLGEVFVGTKVKFPVEIVYPSEGIQSDYVKDVHMERENSNLKIDKIEYKNHRINNFEMGSVFMNVATFFIELESERNTSPNAGTETLLIDIGEKDPLRIPIQWTFINKPTFEPNERQYSLVALTPNEIREFLIIYNSDAGGMPIKIRTTGAGLSITKTQKDGDTVYIKLRYSAGAKPPHGKLGELVVETAAGNKTCAIVAD